MNYDFKNLSPYDFEILCRDLLQKSLSIRLESFKMGKDKGIDLRFCQDSKNKIIVQCKHYASSTFSALLTKLKQEVPKVKALNPARYIVCSSASFGVGDKEKIQELFSTYIKSPEDILGKDDLNNLLGLHPDIHRQCFKLWLSSSETLQSIVHSNILNQSKFLTEAIIEKASLYVENKSLPDVMDILNRHHSCVISGQPGIGKTTLAEMVLLNYAKNEFEIVVINDIEQAYKIFDQNRKQIFFYDDFLGATFFGDKKSNDDSAEILKFINIVSKSNSHKFLMTTREFIISQAQILNEKIGTSGAIFRKCIVDIASYTNKIRTRILLNHIYFSKLEVELINELLIEKRYLQLIKHRNFNPRIIEWMTSVSRMKDINKENYFSKFISFLEDPTDLWSFSFEALSIESKILVLVLGTLPFDVLEDDLKAAFSSSYDAYSKKYNSPKRPRAFLESMKETEGSFIISNKVNADRVIKFHSPAVKDFINSFLPKNPDYQSVILESVAHIEQVLQISDLNNRAAKIKGNVINLPVSMETLSPLLKIDWTKRAVRTSRHIYLNPYSPERLIAFWILNARTESEQLLVESQVEILVKRLGAEICDVQFLMECLELLDLNQKFYFGRREGIINLSKAAMPSNITDIKDFRAALSFLTKYISFFTEEEEEVYRNDLTDFIKDDISNAASEIHDIDSLESYEEDVRRLCERFSLFEDDYYLEEVTERIKEMHRDRDDYDPEDYSGGYGRSQDSEISDEEIVEIFESIRE